jgi:hypothetical protein
VERAKYINVNIFVLLVVAILGVFLPRTFAPCRCVGYEGFCAIERVLNNLQRTMPSCGIMIRLFVHPLPPSPRQEGVSLSQCSCVSPVELFDGRGGGEGVSEEPIHATARKPGSL